MNTQRLLCTVLGCLPVLAATASAAQAQTIAPAADGTGTQIMVEGDRIDIHGGSLSGDGANLFHSFQEFGLSESQIANFLSQPGIENILGRVVGGNPSVINGLLQVTGGSSNLYLMNPSGIIFGSQAQLNVLGDFTATTATGIGLDSGTWFNAIGSPDYPTLVGTPNQFAFDQLETGAIAHAGHLTVGSGHAITILAGQTANTGTLTAPEGQVTIAAVPGESLIRISQPGHLLSLEIEPPRTATGELDAIAPLDLPALLTGPTGETGLTATAAGEVQLDATGTVLPNAAEMSLVSGKITAAEVNLLGDRVGLFAAQVEASGATGGGDVRIGGEYRGEGDLPNATFTYVDSESIINANALESGDGGRVIIWSDDTTRFFGEINATGVQDGGFVEVSGKTDLVFPSLSNVNVSGQLGNPGTLLLDPENIVVGNFGSSDLEFTNDNNVFASEGTGTVNIDISDLESALVSGSVTLAATNDITFQVDVTPVFSEATLIIDAGNTVETQSIAFDIASTALPNLSITANESININGDISLDNFSVSASEGSAIQLASNKDINIGGSIVLRTSSTTTGSSIKLTSSETINIGESIVLNTTSVESGSIELTASESVNVNGSINTNQSNTIQLKSQQGITVGEYIEGDNGNISLDSGLIKIEGANTDGNSIETSNSGSVISIAHDGGVIGIPFVVGDASRNGTSGAITNGTNTLSPTESIRGNLTVGNISITTTDNSSIGDLCSLSGCAAVSTLDLVGGNPPGNDESADSLVTTLDKNYADDFTNYLGLEEASIVTEDQTQDSLRDVESATGIKPAILYVDYVATELAQPTPESSTIAQTKALLPPEPFTTPDLLWEFTTEGFSPLGIPLAQNRSRAQRDSDRLELVLITPDAPPIRRTVAGATRSQIRSLTRQFQRNLNRPSRSTAFLNPAQELYNQIIAPILPDLERLEVDHIGFIADAGLRSLPFAALHNGDRFLIEDYSVNLIPSISLTDLRYSDLETSPVLAMGAATFTNQSPLPAVPLELSLIAEELRSGQAFLNQEFTIANLQNARQTQPFPIVHLATHGEFRSGQPENSYIELWGDRLPLSEIRELELYNPLVELLVLSACRTALGDEEAELGFAGLAVASGAKTALGSLWYVSDQGTLSLMTAFYEQLTQAPIRAEALRQAQLSLLRGETRVAEGQLITPTHTFPINAALAQAEAPDFSHPYYWSAFTMIGSPW
ncbi:MAG: CHAT domain-containing protein [Spirulinaceae cyanobacterium]